MNQCLDQDELREFTLAEVTHRHAKAITRNIVAFHHQTVSHISEEVAHQLSQPGVMEELVRVSQAMGDLSAGQAFNRIVGKCIREHAAEQASKEIEKTERSISVVDRNRLVKAQARREIAGAYYGYAMPP